MIDCLLLMTEILLEVLTVSFKEWRELRLKVTREQFPEFWKARCWTRVTYMVRSELAYTSQTQIVRYSQ